MEGGREYKFEKVIKHGGYIDKQYKRDLFEETITYNYKLVRVRTEQLKKGVVTI